MPDTPVNPLGVNMSDAPGGDDLIESLFPAEDTIPAVEAQPQSEPAVEEPVVTPTTPSRDYYLKTSTGTVYKTEDDAIRGTEHKDATINELRSKLQTLTGVDPLSKRSRQPEVVRYSQQPEKYYEDTEAAVQAKDKVKFAKVTQQLVQETIADAIGAYGPVLQRLAVRDAQDAAASQVKGLSDFIRSDAYGNVLKENFVLGNAIKNAEADPRFRYLADPESGQVRDVLPELYNLAYKAATAAQVPVLAKHGTVSVPATPPQRPTMTAGHVSDVRTQAAGEANFATPEGRKAIIERAKARGVENMIF